MNLVNIFSILAVAKAARLGQDPGFNGGVPGEDPEFPGPGKDSAPFPGSGEGFHGPGEEEDPGEENSMSMATGDDDTTIDGTVDENEARLELFMFLSFTLITHLYLKTVSCHI